MTNERLKVERDCSGGVIEPHLADSREIFSWGRALFGEMHIGRPDLDEKFNLESNSQSLKDGDISTVASLQTNIDDKKGEIYNESSKQWFSV